MADPALARALVRWQHAAGPYWPYVCAAPFLADVGRDGDPVGHPVRADRPAGPVPGARARALAARLLAGRGPDAVLGGVDPVSTAWPAGDASAMAVQAAGTDAGVGRCERQRPGEDGPGPSGASVAVLVDLPIEPGVAAAPILVAHGWYVVPVIQRWIATPAVLPCRRLVAGLVTGAVVARRPAMPRGVVLLADGDRTGRPSQPGPLPGARRRAFDNRYEYQICRFPSIAFLEAQGVRRVRWITRPPRTGIVAPDLVPYCDDLVRAGITVEVQVWPSATS